MYDELFKSVTYEWQQINDLSLIRDIATTFIDKYYYEGINKEEWLNNLKLLWLISHIQKFPFSSCH